MPRLSQYYVKSSLLCLGFGFTIAALLLMVKGGGIDARLWLWRSAHIDLLLNGWLVQLAMGVAYWIFPRILLADRGRPAFAWAAFVILQMGLGLAFLSLLGVWWTPAMQFLAPGVVLQAIGILIFIIHLWPRVRGAMVRNQE